MAYSDDFLQNTWRSGQGNWQGAGQYGAGPQFQQQLLGMQQQQAQTQRGGLPPGGLDAQLESINAYYDQVRNAQIQLPKQMRLWGGGGGARTFNIGFDPQGFQAAQLGGVGEEMAVEKRSARYSNDLNSLARSLAQNYGLDIGRGDIVDERGNLLLTPDQVQASSGGSETIGSAAAKLNYLSAAISKEMNLKQQQKGIAALQTGLGQVQKRGRGSLAAMQSGLYQDLADMYSNMEFEAADYSYFIEKERMDLARELDRRARDISKKRARSQFWGGVAMGLGGILGGNWGVAAQGIGMAGSAYADTGYDDRWF
jgi:hypothetical protein